MFWFCEWNFTLHKDAVPQFNANIAINHINREKKTLSVALFVLNLMYFHDKCGTLHKALTFNFSVCVETQRFIWIFAEIRQKDTHGLWSNGQSYRFNLKRIAAACTWTKRNIRNQKFIFRKDISAEINLAKLIFASRRSVRMTPIKHNFLFPSLKKTFWS